MAQTNDETFLKKGLSKTNDEIFKRLIQDSGVIMETGGYTLSSDKARELIKEAIHEARLAERAKCIAQLKDHQAHCDNCAKDNIEMAIIILEKNEAIE